MMTLYKLKRHLDINLTSVKTFRELFLLCDYIASCSTVSGERSRAKNDVDKIPAKSCQATLERKKKEVIRNELAFKQIAETGKCPCSPLINCPCSAFIKNRKCTCGVFNQWVL